LTVLFVSVVLSGGNATACDDVVTLIGLRGRVPLAAQDRWPAARGLRHHDRREGPYSNAESGGGLNSGRRVFSSGRGVTVPASWRGVTVPASWRGVTVPASWRGVTVPASWRSGRRSDHGTCRRPRAGADPRGGSGARWRTRGAPGRLAPAPARAGAGRPGGLAAGRGARCPGGAVAAAGTGRHGVRG